MGHAEPAVCGRDVPGRHRLQPAAPLERAIARLQRPALHARRGAARALVHVPSGLPYFCSILPYCLHSACRFSGATAFDQCLRWEVVDPNANFRTPYEGTRCVDYLCGAVRKSTTEIGAPKYWIWLKVGPRHFLLFCPRRASRKCRRNASIRRGSCPQSSNFDFHTGAA